ncbi:CPSF A subunit region-domain-containing protein [Chiua virens]|nr:CPSF A subunit region-domain-containing protein [Chiua virens]
MHALRHDILSASGVDFAVSLNLTSSTSSTVVNIVTAKSNLLRVYGIRELPSPIFDHVESERDKRARVRKGTEAVEGEVEMDQSGEGWVNMGTVKSNVIQEPATTYHFYLMREHTLHGTVTGIDKVRTISSSDDKLDRLLVSLKDAKIALLEWSEATHDLVTVSIHTYERSPQMSVLDSHLFRAELRADPLSRCAALSLPKDSLAILPFYQTQAELDVMEQDQSLAREVPYSPSFVLDLVADVDPNVRNVIDFVFLPGYNNPTIAVLCQSEKTWAGRLKEFRDTGRLYIFTLDLLSHTYPIITAVDNLPYDCLSLLPCAQSIGGVVILTVNSLIYVDQAARRVSLPVNGWSARVSDIHSLPLDKDLNLSLEGSSLVFADEKTFFVIRKDGIVHPVEIISDGRTVSKLVLSPALAQTTIPAVTKQLDGGMLFVGSSVGPSVLLKAVRVKEEVEEGEADDTSATPAAVVDTKNSMDIDDFEDDDLYGESKSVTQMAANGVAPGARSSRTRSVVHLSLCDSLPAYGPIADMTFSLSKLGERYVPELVVATGSSHLGGFTLFQRDLPIRTKRKLHVLGGARGIWSIPVRQSHRVNGTSYEKTGSGLFAEECDTIVISTDANPSPGVSRIATRTAKADLAIPTRIPGTTVGAGPFFQRTAVLHVMTNAIRVLEPDGICDPFVLILREDDTIGLFIGEMERGKIRRKDMSPMGEKSSRYLTGCFYTDKSGLFEMTTTDGTVTAGADKTITSTLQTVVTAGHNSQWLALVRPQGTMEIWSLPKLTLVFSTGAITALEPVLNDTFDPPALSPLQDPPRKPQDLDIEQILIAPLGESAPIPHLFVFMRCGHLAIYDAHSISPPTPPKRQKKPVLAEQKRIFRTFVPFVTSPTTSNVNGSHTLTGVFFTGDRPSWILRTDRGGLKLFPSGHAVVHAFTACSLWESKAEFLVYSDEGPSLLEWMPDIELDTSLPKRSLPRSRPYSNVVFEPSASLIVAASTLQARFASYDEDNNILWEPDGAGVSFPQCDCSTLELISPDNWMTMDGYEFAPNEYVNALECVTLETLSTESGSRDFIAVGTSIDRGEDLAVKGATYIFEVVEVVPDPSCPIQRWYKLKLRVRDDAKGPVTALCGINGYLVSSMGQKIFVRAFDLDERLVGVAFLDVGVYVTSLRVLKNLLLIGDAVKSVWLVAFQEDPYKLVILAKDIRRTYATNIDFFFTNGELSIVLDDEEGVLRLLSYDPSGNWISTLEVDSTSCVVQSSTATRSAELLVRLHGERRRTMRFHRRSSSPDSQTGSLSALTPVDEGAFKRLHLLQGQLVRNVQHVASLNPRAYRIVRNDAESKPLSRGVLDGQLLGAFEEQSIQGQQEMTRQIGTERMTVLRDWKTFFPMHLMVASGLCWMVDKLCVYASSEFANDGSAFVVRFTTTMQYSSGHKRTTCVYNMYLWLYDREFNGQFLLLI